MNFNKLIVRSLRMKQKHSIYGEFALVLAVVINSFGVVLMY